MLCRCALKHSHLCGIAHSRARAADPVPWARRDARARSGELVCVDTDDVSPRRAVQARHCALHARLQSHRCLHSACLRQHVAVSPRRYFKSDKPTHSLLTGYMLVNYMVRQGLSVAEALRLFASHRPPGIYKADYIDALFKYNHELPCEAPPHIGLAHWPPHLSVPTCQQANQFQPSQACGL